jgi:hypothetical protein
MQKPGGIAPGQVRFEQKALKARHNESPSNLFAIGNIARLQRCYRWSRFPGAMPQAFAFRAVGAEPEDKSLKRGHWCDSPVHSQRNGQNNRRQ